MPQNTDDLYVKLINSTFIFTSVFVFCGFILVLLKIGNFLEQIELFIINNTIIHSFLSWISDSTLIFNTFKFISDFIYTFKTKDLVDTYISGVNIIDISNPKVLAIIVGIVAFSYFFVQIKDKGVLIHKKGSNESRMLATVENFFHFYSILTLIMIVFLIRQLNIIELLFLIIFALFYNIYVSKMANITIGVIFNYLSILKLNTEHRQMFYVTKKYNELIHTAFPNNPNKIRDVTLRKYCEYRHLLILGNIFLLAFLIPYIAYLFNFNIITLVIIESILVVCYYRVSLTKYIPNHNVDITLNDENQSRIIGAFKTGDFPYLDYIEIITDSTAPNETIRIPRSSIFKINNFVYN
jgi:hypothetical protein